jgi:SNF2 family DNA or RNA helicase
VVMDRSGKCVKPWNQGKIKMLLIHPQSGGHGLNMQHGGHHLVFFDIPWSLELYLQLIGRLARQGQKHVVIVQLLLAVGTLDYAVYAALCEKEDAQERLFVLLKALIRKARKAKSMRAVAVDQYATEEL